MAEKVKRVVSTSLFRGSYPNLLVPKAYVDPETKKAKGNPVYTLEMIYDLEDLKSFQLKGENNVWSPGCNIVALCKEMAAEKWPGEELKDIFPMEDGIQQGWPIKSGDRMAAKLEAKGKKFDHYKGKKFISCKASEEFAPSLLLRVEGKTVELDRSVEADMARAKKLFGNGGNFYRAELTAEALALKTGNFISFYVNGVVFIKDGPKLGNGSMAERFDGILGGEGDFSPSEEFGED